MPRHVSSLHVGAHDLLEWATVSTAPQALLALSAPQRLARVVAGRLLVHVLGGHSEMPRPATEVLLEPPRRSAPHAAHTPHERPFAKKIDCADMQQRVRALRARRVRV